MLTRSNLSVEWRYLNDLAIGATFYLDVGAHGSGYNATGGVAPAGQYCFPVRQFPFFSIDVQTDDLVEIDIQTGITIAAITTMTTLFCPAVLGHNTVYQLPAPYNQNGILILSSNFLRLQVRNVSGNVVSPFHLEARVWQ